MTPAVTGGPTLAVRAEALLAQHWWQPQPSALAQLLRPTFGLTDSQLADVLPDTRWDARLDSVLHQV